MEREHEKYERLIARCKSLTPARTAVAHPCDESWLRAAVAPWWRTRAAEMPQRRWRE